MKRSALKSASILCSRFPIFWLSEIGKSRCRLSLCVLVKVLTWARCPSPSSLSSSRKRFPGVVAQIQVIIIKREMRQDKRAAPKAPINENISAREVRLIGAEGEQLGIVSIEDALLKAEEAKLDLVEISADAVPPVCKLMDYGKSIFEKKKQIAAAKKTRSRSRLKKSSFVQGRRKGITR